MDKDYDIVSRIQAPELLKTVFNKSPKAYKGKLHKYKHMKKKL